MDRQEILNLIQEQARQIAEEVYASKGTRFGVADIPTHTHNGVDSLQVPPEGLEMVEFLPATQNPAGVVSSTVLINQVVDNPAQEGLGNPAQVPSIPIPIIYGYGTTTAIAFTSARGQGSTSGTLTVAWGGSTASYTTEFEGQMRTANFTNSSTAVTWTPGLTFGMVGANATVVADSRFKGGDAPFGTVIGFRNDDDGIQQIWVKMFGGILPETWAGFDATDLIIGYDY